MATDERDIVAGLAEIVEEVTGVEQAEGHSRQEFCG